MKNTKEDDIVLFEKVNKKQPATGITAKEYVCIMLKIPNSGTEWIDELIKTSNKKHSKTIKIK